MLILRCKDCGKEVDVVNLRTLDEDTEGEVYPCGDCMQDARRRAIKTYVKLGKEIDAKLSVKADDRRQRDEYGANWNDVERVKEDEI